MTTCDPSTAAGLTKFGLTLFALLTEEVTRSVVLLSPLSIAAALSLAAAGATAESAAERELLGTLGVASHTAIADLGAAMLSGNSRGVTLRTANSVWITKDVLPSYQQSVAQTHGARAERLGTAYDDLNAWVAAKTEGRIPKLMDPTKVDPLVVAVLVNAVFFEGEWAAAFDPSHTFDRPFLAPGGALPARFMQRTGDFAASPSVARLGGAAVLKLDYGATTDGVPAEFAALLVLPAEAGPKPLAAAVAGLDGDGGLAGLMSEVARQKVSVQLPRFKAEWGVQDLVPQLRKLGLGQVFDEDGQFLKLSTDPSVHVSAVMHKATIEVTEKGTVAAASTAAVMMKRSLPRPPLQMTFDRPFLMLVLHVPTAVPLFVGRFNQPQLI